MCVCVSRNKSTVGASSQMSVVVVGEFLIHLTIAFVLPSSLFCFLLIAQAARDNLLGYKYPYLLKGVVHDVPYSLVYNTDDG